MGWCTTSDLDRFAAAAGGYLRSRAAENTLLLSAAQAAGRAADRRSAGSRRAPPGQRRRDGAAVLFGWWEPPDGGEPRGAFVHDPAVPLLIAGRAPEMARRARRHAREDGPAGVRRRRADRGGGRVRGRVEPAVGHDRPGAPALPRLPARRAWPPAGGAARPPARSAPARRSPAAYGPASAVPASPPPRRRARGDSPITAEDHGLLADLLVAFGIEAAERIGSPSDLAADLISYGGAVFWEVPQRAQPPQGRRALPADPAAPGRRTAARRSPPPAGGAGDPDPPGRRDGPDRHRLHAAGAPPQRLRDRADAGRQPRAVAGGHACRRTPRAGPASARS